MGAHSRSRTSTHCISRGHVQLWTPTNRGGQPRFELGAQLRTVRMTTRESGHPIREGFGRPRTSIGHPIRQLLVAHFCKHGHPPTMVGLPIWVGLDVHCGQMWLPNMDGCGLPAWAGVVVRHGWIWASNMGKRGRPLWTDMDS